MSGINPELERRLSEGLARLAAETGGLEAPPSVEANLRSAFRERQRRWPLWRPWAAGAVAAALALLLLWWPGGHPAPPSAPPQEVVTDFFPLRNGPLLDPDELAQVVRVRVPRDTMLRFGLPVELPGPGTTIQADVLVGQDGMARAVRFVKGR